MNLLDRAAEVFHFVDRRTNAQLDLRIEAIGEEFHRHANSQLFEILFLQRFHVIGNGQVSGGGIQRVVTRNGAEQKRRIRHIFGDGTDLIQR